jgi:hypothetical protein
MCKKVIHSYKYLNLIFLKIEVILTIFNENILIFNKNT